jgi:PAS domain S-box-containing protein
MIPGERPAVRVLNVDDDDLTRYSITQILRRGGYDVIEGRTAAEALHAVATEHPAIVILDVNLPDGDGIEVCRRIKGTAETALVPVVQLSASAVGIEDQVAGLEGGADAYLLWPVDQHVLLATVKSLLRAREAEAAASLLGRQWQATVDAARDGIAVVDPAGRLVRANRRIAELTRVAPEELVGLHLPTLLDPDRTTGLDERITAAVTLGEALPFELRVGTTWLRTSLDRIENERGAVMGVVLALTDVTEARRLLDAERDSRTTLMAIVGQMPVGLLVADDEGRIVLHNAHLEAIAGRAFSGTSLFDESTWHGVRHAGEPVTVASSPFVRSLVAGDRWDDEEMTVDGAHGERTLRFSAAPIEIDGRITSVVATFTDISERKALEAIRDTFIGILSHELRTPVTTILGGSRLLDSRRETMDPKIRDELITDITGEAERLHRLVEDLLVLARTERGVPMHVADPVLLQHILPAVVASEQRFWPGLRVDAEIGTLPTASGDAAYVEQVVRNLLSNAAKYGAEQAPVELRAAVEGDEVTITVCDRGPGIAPGDAERVFDLFYRAQSAGRRASGAGIGLFVCRQLVHAMGGRIWVGPREGGGTEFGFAMPLYVEATMIPAGMTPEG